METFDGDPQAPGRQRRGHREGRRLTLGPWLAIDSDAETFVDNPAADALLTRDVPQAVRGAGRGGDLNDKDSHFTIASSHPRPPWRTTMSARSEPAIRSTSTRRDFLKTSAAALGAAACTPYLVPASVFGATAPSNRINVGFIGMRQPEHDRPAGLPGAGRRPGRGRLRREHGQPRLQDARAVPRPQAGPGEGQRLLRGEDSRRASTRAATPTTTSARCSAARTSTPWRSSCPTTGTP